MRASGRRADSCDTKFNPFDWRVWPAGKAAPVLCPPQSDLDLGRPHADGGGNPRRSSAERAAVFSPSGEGYSRGSTNVRVHEPARAYVSKGERPELHSCWMDYLPSPPDAKVPATTVPYLASVPYDFQGFGSFAERHGFL